MPLKILLCFALVAGVTFASDSRAQTEQKCAIVPICFPPYNPPVDGMIFYHDDVPVLGIGPTCPSKVARCTNGWFWAPKGGWRTSLFYCAPIDAAISISVYRGNDESPRAKTYALDDAPPGNCWEQVAPELPALTMRSLQSGSDHLSTLLDDCLTDPSCGAFVLAECLRSSTCQATLTTKLGDYNMDGYRTATDTAWWQMLLDGRVPSR